ncbi:MAG: hypothetical protein M3Q69_21610 [Acidobacteriota bacterium]|nr:hypothetical protein [Acidobacteriota bacterium]
MNLGKRKPALLLAIGTACSAGWGILYRELLRGGHATDLTDFAAGIVMGVGIGLSLVAVAAMMRARGSNGAA